MIIISPTSVKSTFCHYFLVGLIAIMPPALNAEKLNHQQENHMISIRKASERGNSNLSWLKSFFTFSFADYYDSKYMGFRSLRVINEDTIKGGQGFEPHSHKDMEIITYVVKGALQHKDSMGNTSIIHPGEVQRMSAGTGIVHSEYNGNKDSEVHLYQIWILPNKKSTQPGYAQKSFEADFKTSQLVLVASNNARAGSISIAQDVDLYISHLSKDNTLNFEIKPERHVWVQIIKGRINVNGHKLNAGDGLSATPDKHSAALYFSALENSELMLFDLG